MNTFPLPPVLQFHVGDTVMVRNDALRNGRVIDVWFLAEVMEIRAGYVCPYRVNFPQFPNAVHIAYSSEDLRAVNAEDVAKELAQ